MTNYKVKLKRVYEKSEIEDGFRVLVDRLWSRGLSKEKAKVDLWLKEIAPSNALRKWFGHKPARWKEFLKKYKKELNYDKQIDLLKDLLKKEEKSYFVICGKR